MSKREHAVEPFGALRTWPSVLSMTPYLASARAAPSPSSADPQFAKMESATAAAGAARSAGRRDPRTRRIATKVINPATIPLIFQCRARAPVLQVGARPRRSAGGEFAERKHGVDWAKLLERETAGACQSPTHRTQMICRALTCAIAEIAGAAKMTAASMMRMIVVV